MIDLLFALWIVSAQAESLKQSELGPIEVYGSSQNLQQPFVPLKVSKKKLETYQYTDVNRALKNVSGAYTREEDGQGLRPNIGLRGTNPDRSKKVVLMEDGILIGPAPYSAPAAYYTPSMAHVDSLEIYKGFAALPYGPNSIGGAVDYITRAIPFDRQIQAGATYGSFNSLNVNALLGGSAGRHGYLLQGSRVSTDGFKQLDGGGETGFEQTDFLGKLEWVISEKSRILFTGGLASEKSHETYLGLSESDFSTTPYRRYAASENDRMKWNHSTARVRWMYQLASQTTLEVTGYRNDFHRAWYRMDAFRDSNVNLRQILNDPTGGNSPYYDILRGQADTASVGTPGELSVVNNDRTFFSQGLQTRWGHDAEFGEHKHSLEFFARFHQDQISRHHTYDFYEMTHRHLVRTGAPTQTSKKDTDSATAWTLGFSEKWTWGAWVLSPAVRFETIQFLNNDHLTTTKISRRDEFWVPGLSLSRQLGDRFSLRASVNQAVTASGLSSTGEEKREEGTNYELELRYEDPLNNQRAGWLYFYNDYRNLTGTCTVSAGCNANQLDTQFNGGRALIQGLEFDAAKGFQWGKVYLPVQLNVTYLNATFRSNFSSTSAEWGVGSIRSGDPLPYVPKMRYTLSIGSEYGRFKQDFSFVYHGAMYDQSALTNRIEIPAYGIVDWAGAYQLAKSSRVVAKADNILGREYAVAARPFGLRPGKARGVYIGWIQQF